MQAIQRTGGWEELRRMRQLGQRIFAEELWLLGGARIGLGQLIEGGVAVRDVHYAARQRQCLQELLWTAEGTNIDGCNPGEHLPRYVCLYGQRNVAQIDVTLIGVCIIEGQIDTFLTLEVCVVLAHLGQYANFIDHGLDDVARGEGGGRAGSRKLGLAALLAFPCWPLVLTDSWAYH